VHIHCLLIVLCDITISFAILDKKIEPDLKSGSLFHSL